ncbi:MAG: tetratricopeptide repeat protein [Chlorobi bacterium]|nr:tetratricopeptide repeat protein [Chlorobiota bacterium]
MNIKNYVLVISILLSTVAFAQEKEESIKAISEEACDCIAKIDINTTKDVKSEEIKSCITTANMLYQMKQSLMGEVSKAVDSLINSKIDTLVIKGNEKNIITVDENYKEIEEFLYDNCSAMKAVYFTDNSEYDNSFSDRKKAIKFYNTGQIAFQKEEYEMAIVMFRKAVKKDKKFAFAWDNLGYSYRKIGNYKEAITSYKKSLELDPKGKMPLMNIAVAYQLDGDNKNAIKAYQKYEELYSDDPEGFYGLGRIYYLEKNYKPALENMIQAYLLYVEMNSSYNIDAQKHISFIYNELKEKGELKMFNEIAKKYNLTVNDED